jgi:hypothetical protein
MRKLYGVTDNVRPLPGLELYASQSKPIDPPKPLRLTKEQRERFELELIHLRRYAQAMGRSLPVRYWQLMDMLRINN